VGCDETTLIAFLEGRLPPDVAARTDAHLLHCEACWAAVHQDRQGREALESLREGPPSGLLDRVRLAVEAEATDGPAVLSHRPPRRGRRWRVGVAAVAAALLPVVGLAGWAHRSPVRDPAVVAAVVRLARQTIPSPADAANPVRAEDASLPVGDLEAGGQRFSLARYQVEGHDLLVATSALAFPMPAGARALAAGEDAPWVARRGDLGVACFSRPVHLLVAGRLPPDDIAALAARLQLH
jgi:anti-sigma factor RsiW